MAADDDAKTGGGWINIKPFYVVDDVDSDFSNFNNRCFRKPARPPALVIVSSNRNDWSDRLENPDNFGLPDVTGMDDQIGAPKGLKRLRPEQAVSVGDNADDRLSDRMKQAADFRRP